MAGFQEEEFSEIKDQSNKRRLPRLGRIRLGIKKISEKTGNEYPVETPYFVVDENVARVYGDKPIELDVLVPINNLKIIAPQKYIWFGKSKGARCMGNLSQAKRLNEQTKKWEPRECPCELLNKECNRQTHLFVILPKVSVGGIYQITSRSFHSMVDINSCLDYVETLVGRFAMVPLKMRRVPKETHGSGRKETHYPIMLLLDEPEKPEDKLAFLNSLRDSTRRVLEAQQRLALPAPIEENPAMDDAVVEVEEDEPERVADVGETSVALPPVDDPYKRIFNLPPVQSPTETPTESPTKIVSTNAETAFVGETNMTEAEVMADLEGAGMIKQPEPAQDDKVREAKLLNSYAKEIARMPDAKALNTWFSTNCLPMKKEFSEDGYWQLTKLVNDKLRSFKKK